MIIDKLKLLNKLNTLKDKKIIMILFIYIIENDINYIKGDNNFNIDLNNINNEHLIYINKLIDNK